MKNKLKFLGRPCCSCNKMLIGYRITKRYCDPDCKYAFHKMANLQIHPIIFKGLLKYKRRNVHLVELLMGPDCELMWASLDQLEKKGFRLNKCMKQNRIRKSRFGSSKTIYFISDYRIIKIGNKLLIQRFKDKMKKVQREIIFQESTHERYLHDPHFKNYGMDKTFEYERLFESEKVNFGLEEVRKLDQIFEKFGVWRM